MSDANASSVPEAAAIPAPIVLHLFADRFIPVERPGQFDQRSFGTGTVVPCEALAEHLVAVAFWSLREQGALHLAAFHEKKLGPLPVSGARAKPGTPVATSGLESTLLAGALADKQASSRGARISDVICAVIPRTVHPALTLVSTVILHEIELGYLTRSTVAVRGLSRVLSGGSKTEVEPVDQAIAALDADATDLARRWQAFRSAADGLHAALLQEVRKGIKRTELQDNPPD